MHFFLLKLAETKYSCLHQQPDSKSVNDEYAVDPKSYSLEVLKVKFKFYVH